MNKEEKVLSQIARHDKKNLAEIQNALNSGRIDATAAEYLTNIYYDGMQQFREMFYVLGKCFGAPKTAVFSYDPVNDKQSEEPVKIIDIKPTSAYIVHHRLDEDPMRNQFFKIGDGHKVALAASSIVSVLVGAQKDITRSLDKITGKYYTAYVDEILKTSRSVLGKNCEDTILKIKNKFYEKYVSHTSETVIQVIGCDVKNKIVPLVRALDQIQPAHQRLNDIWRVKCLFDLIPQARTFIERITAMFPTKILRASDKFYDLKNPRNYRDAKVVMNISNDDKTIIPMEIMCQMRVFFNYEKRTHRTYENQRFLLDEERLKTAEQKQRQFLEDGIRKYNTMICEYTGDLMERVGWNILYNRGNRTDSLFEGFPKKTTKYYPEKFIDAIFEKLDNSVKNEIFKVEDSPRKLETSEEIDIFRFLARFIMVSSMPYREEFYKIPGKDVTTRLFNFIMSEIYRYNKDI